MSDKIIFLDALPPPKEISEEDIVKLVENIIAEYEENNPDGILNVIIIDSMMRIEKINNGMD
jgi:hypothetical protein